jgi:hypothetical protein
MVLGAVHHFSIILAVSGAPSNSAIAPYPTPILVAHLPI